LFLLTSGRRITYVHVGLAACADVRRSLQDFYTKVRSHRSDLNAAVPVLPDEVRNGLLHVLEVVNNVKSSLGNNTSFTGTTLLSSSQAWNWLIVGRVQSPAAEDSVAAALVPAVWRKRCEEVRGVMEKAMKAGDALEDLLAETERLRSANRTQDEALRSASRRTEELSALLEKQNTATHVVEEQRVKLLEAQKKESALKDEVKVLNEAIAVLESRMEELQGELRRVTGTGGGSSSNVTLSSRQGNSGSGGGGSSGASTVGSSADSAALASALESALLESRSWRQLVVRNSILSMAPLPVLKPVTSAAVHVGGSVSGSVPTSTLPVRGAGAEETKAGVDAPMIEQSTRNVFGVDEKARGLEAKVLASEALSLLT